MNVLPHPTVAIPSKGRLREQVLDLISHAGYSTRAFNRSDASAVVEGIEFIEMRPRDAAAWLRAGRLSAAFISTDTALENEIEDWAHRDLGFARSDLVVACKESAEFSSLADLDGATVATHLPRWTERWLELEGIKADVVTMGGSLEGVCAVGMADAIVDLRETGRSLQRNRLRVLATGRACQARFTWAEDGEQLPGEAVSNLILRINAALEATTTQYLMLHIAPDQLDRLPEVFPGLAAPTVLPLAGRDDLVAAHLVVNRSDLWTRLPRLRALGATAIVALATDAILP